MRFLRLDAIYPAYLRQFYDKHPQLAGEPYANQHAALLRDAAHWADFWSTALAKLGYETTDILGNADTMQRTWARENNVAFTEDNWLFEIVAAQIKAYRPDILFLSNHHTYTAEFLRQLKRECPFLRRIVGWCGAPFSDVTAFREYDLLLSCIPELVEKFRQLGFRTQHLNHAFEPRILERIDAHRPPHIDFSFVGQIVRRDAFHLERERLVGALVRKTNLQVWANLEYVPAQVRWYHATRKLGYRGVEALRWLGVSELFLETFGPTAKLIRWRKRSNHSHLVDQRIARDAHTPVYGLDMFQLLHDSRVTLNTHIDISPRSASNMRLFEATGMGTCLLTDWKDNLSDLFEIDKEVVAYRSIDECLEKARYLLDHESERAAIAAAGQKRTLRDHTFTQRAAQFDALLRS